MKKIITLALIGLMAVFAGCTTKTETITDVNGVEKTKEIYVGVLTGNEYPKEAIDTAYGVAKGIYLVGKEVVVANSAIISEETMDKLKDLNDIAVQLDSTKKAIEKVAEKNGDAVSD